MIEPIRHVARRSPEEIGAWLYRRIRDFGGSAVGAHHCAAAMIEAIEALDRENAGPTALSAKRG